MTAPTTSPPSPATPGQTAAAPSSPDGGEPSREHQVVVVFDVTADSRVEAAQRIAEMYRRGSTHRGNLRAYGVESWWFPESDLKHVDGNDNAPGRLVFDDDADNLGAVCDECGGSDKHLSGCPWTPTVPA